MRTAARASLVLLALALPFEPRQPIARLGPLVLTLAELFLYAAIAIGGAVIVADAVRNRAWRLIRDPKSSAWRDVARRHVVAVAWLLALALSAAAAEFARADAVKFALRSAGGVALYVVAAHMLRSPAAALAVAAAIAAGAAVAALGMWAELNIGGAAAILAPFHTGTFDVLGLPRASGPFQYPNIAAMYVEAALPLALAVGAAIDARRRAAAGVGGRPHGLGARVPATMLGLLLVQALSLTASRAAMATAGVVLLAVTSHALWRRTLLRWPAAAALAAAVLLAVAATATGSLTGLRLKFWKDAVWYRSQIAPVAAFPTSLATGSRTAIDVDVKNTGARAWPAAGEQRVTLSYHWFDAATSRTAVFDGSRTALPRDIASDEVVRLRATVLAPDSPGRYRIHMQMVHEGVTWFGDQGDAGYQSVVDVVTATAPALPPSFEAEPQRLGSASRADLWRAALMAWREHPLTGLGPDNFRRAYGRYLGLQNPDPRLHANNLYLETLASLGLAGVGALLLTIVWFWRAGRRALRAHGAATPAGLLATGVCAALAAYLVHGFFDYFLEFTPTYALLWLLGGMLTALGDGQGDRRDTVPKS